jgi:phospholipid/cholesterol/gamma-HCH transport system permease protein
MPSMDRRRNEPSTAMGMLAGLSQCAKRISEEIHALEVIAIKSVAYLASTRAPASFVMIVPQYATAIMTSLLAAQITTTFSTANRWAPTSSTSAPSCAPRIVGWPFVQATIRRNNVTCHVLE